MKTRKLVLLTTSLGVCSIAVALALTANHMYSGAFGLGLQNAPANATSKTFTLNLGTEHTFDSNNKATEYAINENANNYGVEFLLTKVSNESDAMSVNNGKTRLRYGDSIENVNALSGVTSITVNGGNGNFNLYAGYDPSAMFMFLEATSNGGSRTFDNIPNCNYFKLVGKYDNYECDISSIEFTYTATGSTCNYGQGIEASQITVNEGTYNKYSGDTVVHTAVVSSNAILFDGNLYSFAHIVYNGRYLYSQTVDKCLLASFSGDELTLIDCVERFSDISGTYVQGHEATAVTMFVNDSEVDENTASSRMNVVTGTSFTFSAQSDAVPADTVSVEFVDETGVAAAPGVGTYAPKSTMTVIDIYGTWEGGDSFELAIDPIVVTKVGEVYYAEYSDAGYGDYAGTSGSFEGALSNAGVLSFESTDGKLTFDINTNINKLNWSYVDDDALVYAMGDVNCNFLTASQATAEFNNGTVTVLNAGDFHLTATAANGVSATLYVHADAYVAATVTVSEPSVTLTEGETYQINATVNADATNKTLSYSTNKNSVASVSNTGLVTAKAEGNAVITVTTADGNTATVNVTVNKPASTVYTFTDDYGVDFTVTVVEGVSITLDNGYQDAVFAFDSVATCYRYVDDEYCVIAIRKAGGAVYLDFSDDNCSVFYYTIVGSSDTTGSFELTLA